MGLDRNSEDIRQENKRLRLAVGELTILNDIATAIGSTLSLDRVMELVVRKCIKHFHTEQGAVMLIDPHDNSKPLHTMIRRVDRSESVLPYRLDTQLIGWMLKHKKPLLVNDLVGDSRFTVSGGESHGIRSVLSAPLLFKGSIIGLLNVFNKKSRDGFSEADKRLLAIIATQSAQVIENARLYEEEQTLLGIQEEMRIAYRIQTGLLPQGAPDIPGYDVVGKSIPAALVGGDYYDFIKTTDGRWGVCLGDVSGKGMPAALLMANLQATLRSQILQGLPVGRCLERSNSLIFRSTAPDRFATLFYGVLDQREHTLCFANAGHNPPLLFRCGVEPLPLRAGGTVLGSFETTSYEEDEVHLEAGDVILIYSDGVSEATDASGQQFGDERIAEIVVSNPASPVGDILGMVLDAAQNHAGAETLKDDMTVVVIKRVA
jgi:sigma-B regulation protein RsbU (phosphoserine phosphatase)